MALIALRLGFEHQDALAPVALVEPLDGPRIAPPSNTSPVFIRLISTPERTENPLPSSRTADPTRSGKVATTTKFSGSRSSANHR